MRQILSLISQINEAGVFNFLGLIISPLISLLVVRITLKHSDKTSLLQLEESKRQHKDNMLIQKQQHNNMIEMQTEEQRVKAMPYIIMKDDINIYIENDVMHFEISFINNGNGTAIELQGKYLEHFPDIDEKTPIGCLCKTHKAVYPTDYPCNPHTASVNGSFRLDMRQELNLKKIERLPSLRKRDDIIDFKILFKDMYKNEYEQSFKLLFYTEIKDKSITFGRVESYTPVLIKENKELYSFR